MKIHIANPTGLCFGVKRAISTLEEELLKMKKVYLSTAMMLRNYGAFRTIRNFITAYPAVNVGRLTRVS